ncbi:hypothetical protein SPAN111604_05690 [Sphingomonas antarctica]|uniref:hypothetical protein n=1 Tax=Sphingomonas antarctica TaxID=2040274 RepID=UPI0039ED3D6C
MGIVRERNVCDEIHDFARAGVVCAGFRATKRRSRPPPRTPLQTDRGYDKAQARTDAINAPNRAEIAPATAAANAPTMVKDAAVSDANANAQAAYDYDMGNYVTMLRAHDATAASNEAQYAAKRRAYADAMRVWRQNVYDCSRGSITACRAPTPDPAAFY